MSTDFRGDPSAALLEVLDPEQNHSVQRPLPRPRLRPLEGDVHQHGEHAGRHPAAAAGPHGGHPHRRATPSSRSSPSRERYLIPKQREANGLEGVDGRRSTTSALRTLIHHYTKEAGVRSLEREIGGDLPQDREATCSRTGERDGTSYVVDAKTVQQLPRAAEVPLRHGRGARTRSASPPASPGPSSAASSSPSRRTVMPGKGKLIITGKLGEVMQESAQAAMSYVRSRAERARPRQALPRERRHPHPLARGRDPEGRPVGRHHHGDGARLGAAAGSRSARTWR